MPDAGKPVSDGQTWADQAGRWDKIRELITHLPSIETPQGVAWFTAQEVVGKAGFDDCVIYYLDDERNTLLQQAALGAAKNPSDRQIAYRLEIPIGEGITGGVAAPREPVMVSNVVSDPRYVADVEPGGSEICVPILAGETVLGVIDCEDARIGHFDEADLAFLRTVANLIGARLQQIDQREMGDPTASSLDRQLFRARARAREIERLAQIGHVVWSGDGSRTIFCSEELASIHDVTPSFYANRTKSWEQRLEWIHPEDRARYQGETRARIAEKIGYNIEYRLRSHTGVVRDVHEFGEPLFDAGGEVLSISAIVRDNTRQRTTDRALSDTEYLLSQVLTHTREGYWYIDNNGRSIDANPALCALLRLQKADIIGRPIFDFVDKRNTRIFESEIAARGSGERGYYEIELSRADGTKVPCINSATPIYDDTGQRVGSVGLWTDITALRASQRQSEISREEAERANRAKSELLSAMSLELRTPLNTALGYGQLLGTHPGISSSEQLTGAASQIFDSGRQLLGFVEKVLDLGRIESGLVDVTFERWMRPPELAPASSL